MSVEDEVRVRAGEIWAAQGRPAGRELDHWYAAKEELLAYKALGRAAYELRQEGAIVITTARGLLPGPGFRAVLEPHRIEPSDGPSFLGYMLMFRKMRDAEALPTPFQVEARFEYRGSVGDVLVYDRDGPHQLQVGGRAPPAGKRKSAPRV